MIDTQTLIRFLDRSKGVNKKATAILEKADRGESIIIIPAVVIFIEKAVNYQEEKLSWYLDAPIITNDPVILKSKYVRCVKSD